MKKLFCRWTISAILVSLVGTAALAQQSREDKQKVRIVVVEKKDSSGNASQSQKHPENRNKRS